MSRPINEGLRLLHPIAQAAALTLGGQAIQAAMWLLGGEYHLLANASRA